MKLVAGLLLFLICVVGCAQQDQQPLPDRPCSHIAIGEELTPLMAYCDGGYCITKETKADCESVDVVTVDENGRLEDQFSPDGKPDCYWRDDLPAISACQPSN